MSKKEEELMEVDVEIEDLNEELMNQFATALEREVNLIFSQYIAYDGREELISVLMSIAASLSIDLDMNIDEFVEYSAMMFEESELVLGDEEKDISTLN